jgi:diguanylate cyclase (GGDEF)-like protein/PAS domain S-box-containing protein
LKSRNNDPEDPAAASPADTAFSSALVRINRAMHQMLSRQMYFEEVCRALVESAGLLSARIATRDSSTKRFVVSASAGDVDGAPLECPPEGAGRERDARLCIPLKSGDEVPGVLELRANRGGFFTQAMIRVCELAGAEIAQAYGWSEACVAAPFRPDILSFNHFAVEQLADPVYWADRGGRIVYANQAASRMLGYTRDEILRLRVSDLDDTPRARNWEERWEEIGKEAPPPFETIHRTRDGEPIAVEMQVRRLFHDGRDYVVGFARDIRARKRAEAVADKRLTYLTSLTSLSSRMIALPADEIDDQLDECLRGLCESLDLDLALLWQWDPDLPESLCLTHAQPPGGPLPSPSVIEARDYLPWCTSRMAEGKTVALENLDSLPEGAARDRETLGRLGIKSSLIIPLSAGGRHPDGALCVATRGIHRTWPEDLDSHLRLVAELLSSALSRQQADMTRRRLEQEHRLLLEGLNAGVVTHDASGKIIFANPAACELLGMTREQVLGREAAHPEWRFLRVDETTLPVEEYPVFRVLETGKPLTGQIVGVNRPASGDVMWGLVKAFPEFDLQGRLSRVNVTFIDITALRRMEQALRDSERRFRQLSEHSLCGVYIVQDGRISYVNEAHARIFGYTREEMIGMTPASTMHPDDVALLEARMRARLTGEEYSSHYEVRGLRKNGSIVDVEILGVRTELDGRPAIIGNLLDITARKQAERELRESEQRFRTIFEQNLAVILLIDPTDGCIVDASEGAARYYGYTIDQLRGKNISRINPKPVSEIRRLLTKVLDEGVSVFQFQHYLASGEQRDVDAFASAILLEGRALIYAIIQDVTERRKAEQALQETSRRLQLALSTAQIGVFEFDMVTGVLTGDEQMLRIYGSTGGDSTINLEAWSRSLHPDDAARVMSLVAAAIRGERDYETEFRIIRPDGEVRVVQAMANALRDKEGRTVKSIGLNRDVTEQRRAEAALREVEERYAKTLAALSDGLWEFDMRTGRAFASSICYTLLGYTVEEHVASRESWESLVHPEDLERTNRAFAEAMAESREFEHDARLRTKSGEWKWIRTRGNAVERDAQGNPVRLLGTLSDISERRRIDERLYLADAALSAAANAIVMTDVQGNIRWVNPAFTRMTGYTAAEAIGSNPRVLRSGTQDASFYARMWSTILAGDVWQGELINRRKDGTLYTEEMTITPVKDTAGQITEFIAIKQDITRRKRIEEELQFGAFHDGLTGLANRALLMDRIDMAHRRFVRSSREPFGLILIDLDRFKNVNDSFGHPIGDLVLQEAAMRFQRAVRGNDTVARLGGDEFAILLEDILGESSPTRVAQRLLEAMEPPFEIEGNLLEISASLGVVVTTGAHKSTTEVFRDADIALYRAKAAGRGLYQVFDEEMHRRVRERMDIEAELRRAIDRRQMELHLQPVVSLKTGKIHSFEALLRWQHPVRGQVPPSVFIPIAEETGLILAIGTWVAREACRILRCWPDVKPPAISINASAIEMLPAAPGSPVPTASRPLAEEFDEKLARIVQEEGIRPELLRVEITESVMISNPEHVTRVLQRLVGGGFRLLLDDFGTGYSSLSYLHDLPFHQVKLDRSFTARLAAGNRSDEIMRGIIALAHGIGLEVIAEGVETAEQLALLRAAGCDHAQGYLLSRPIPVDEAYTLFGSDKRW